MHAIKCTKTLTLASNCLLDNYYSKLFWPEKILRFRRRVFLDVYVQNSYSTSIFRCFLQQSSEHLHIRSAMLFRYFDRSSHYHRTKSPDDHLNIPWRYSGEFIWSLFGEKKKWYYFTMESHNDE